MLQPATPVPAAHPVLRHATFGAAIPGRAVRAVADWIMATGDHGTLPFLIIDKQAARAFVFDADGNLVDTAPVLLGLTPGDHTVPGVGDKPLAKIRPHERTTAAGRFEAELGFNLRGEDVLWIDYDSGLSLHRVLKIPRRERRLERLATPTPADNRVSNGCINVSVQFFERVIRPVFRQRGGVAYVLPETRSVAEVFGMPKPVPEPVLSSVN